MALSYGANVAGNISSYVNTIYEDALLVARDNTLYTGLVTVYRDWSGTATRSIEEYGTANIQDIGDADDLASQVFTPSNLATLTPAEAGGQFLLTDLRVETDPFAVRQQAALELGAAMAYKIDYDGFANLSSLTGGTVGSAGTTITWGHFFAMASRLRGQNAPRPWVFVCHPYQWHRLASASSVANTSHSDAPEYVREEIARTFYVQTIGGVDIFTTNNIIPDASDDAYCAMFHPMALAYDQRRAPRLEPERDASRRAWELNLTSVYATGVWRKKWGIQGIFDAAVPSS